MTIPYPTTGIVVFAHGSSVPSANQAVELVAAEAKFPFYEVAFLDARPNLREGVEKLVQRGLTKILVVPYFLTLGIHLQRDLPALVKQLESEHPGIKMQIAPPLDGHPALGKILADRVREALSV
jgi:sirohydrochlorin ferrochelatase